MSLTEQRDQKQRELQQLTQISNLTESIKSQLDSLSSEVQQLEENSDRVSDVMQIWDNISRAVSQAGLGLLRYVDSDYAPASMDDGGNKNSNTTNTTTITAAAAANITTTNKVDNETIQLPEPLLRVKLQDEEQPSQE